MSIQGFLQYCIEDEHLAMFDKKFNSNITFFSLYWVPVHCSKFMFVQIILLYVYELHCLF